MDDSIVKENRTTKLSLKELMEGSFEDVDKKVNVLVQEASKKKKNENDEANPKEKDNKGLLFGDESKEDEKEDKKFKTVAERDAELKEMTTSGPAIQGSAGGFKDGASSG